MFHSFVKSCNGKAATMRILGVGIVCGLSIYYFKWRRKIQHKKKAANLKNIETKVIEKKWKKLTEKEVCMYICSFYD